MVNLISKSRLVAALSGVKQRWQLLASLAVGLFALYLAVNSWLLPSVIRSEVTPPNLFVAGVDAGSTDYDQLQTNLQQRLQQLDIKLITPEQTISLNHQQAAINIDYQQLATSIKSRTFTQRLKPYGLKRTVELPLAVDSQQLAEQLDELELAGASPATDASFTISDGQLNITNGQAGRGVNVDKLSTELTSSLSINLASLQLSVNFADLEPSVTAGHIEQLEQQILAATKPKVELVGSTGQSTTATDSDKASWWQVVSNDQTPELRLDQQQLTDWLAATAKEFEAGPTTKVVTAYSDGTEVVTTNGVNGRKLSNLEQVTEAVLQAVADRQPISAELAFEAIPFKTKTNSVNHPVASRTITYQVIKRGSVASSLDQFASLAQQTLADSRGWSAAGYRFVRVDSGGSFSLILASPAEVAAASPVCSSEWSCRVGRSVLINDERWRNATSSWNAAGGGLRDYRHMVVNHEVGHFLGFGHSNCPAAGQPAPVMQQQSKSLQGCRFNPWPTPTELSAA